MTEKHQALFGGIYYIYIISSIWEHLLSLKYDKIFLKTTYSRWMIFWYCISNYWGVQRPSRLVFQRFQFSTHWDPQIVYINSTNFGQVTFIPSWSCFIINKLPYLQLKSISIWIHHVNLHFYSAQPCIHQLLRPLRIPAAEGCCSHRVPCIAHHIQNFCLAAARCRKMSQVAHGDWKVLSWCS